MCFKTKIERDKMKMIPYILDIWSIIYMMLCTKPNVSYALNRTSRYQFNPSECH